jgi:phosphocarrier protein
VTASEVISADVEILNRRGLHARAAAKFVRVAEQFDADIKVSKDDQTVPGTSILGLMMLAAAMGTSIHIEAAGEECEAAVDALVTLIEKRFDED